MAQVISVKEAVALIPSGATIMMGGFLGCGSAHQIVDALSKSDKGGFTVIGNDAGIHNGPDGGAFYATAKLVHNKQVAHLIVSHVGMNPEVAQQMNEGTLKLSLIPQGSLAEMIRAGGAGLGGVLTPTGVGTIVEENTAFVLGKQTIEGREHLLMRPITADVAILSGHKVDRAGNIWYKATARNFNPLMATAAKLVIVEADHVVDAGTIEPENVVTPGPYVGYIVDGGEANGAV